MQIRPIVVALALCAMQAAPTLAVKAPGARSIVETELAFSKKTGEVGVRDGFLAFIADDGVLFRPRAVNGKAYLEKGTKRPGLLSWYPTVAGISAAGDMGYTTGPWEFRPNGPADAPVAFGEFATVWKKQADGTWKFVMDAGNEHAAPSAKAPVWTEAASAPTPKAIHGEKDARAGLEAADQAFSTISGEKGTAAAYRAFLATDGRVYRPDSFVAIGADAPTVAAKAGDLTWAPEKTEVASSGDLGYTIGIAKAKSADAPESTYFRIWRRQGGKDWKVIVDVVNPIPPPKPAS